MKRSQIDYILVNERFRNRYKAMKTYSGTDIRSDYNPLVGELKVKMKEKGKSEKQYM